jgi:pre-rRNA-processing protein TSR2
MLQVSVDLVALFEELMRGDITMYSKIINAQPSSTNCKTQGDTSEDDGDEMQDDSMDNDSMEVEPKPSKPEPIIDEDGFELVVKKRGRK